MRRIYTDLIYLQISEDPSHQRLPAACYPLVIITHFGQPVT
jgi:hypothetical protein